MSAIRGLKTRKSRSLSWKFVAVLWSYLTKSSYIKYVFGMVHLGAIVSYVPWLVPHPCRECHSCNYCDVITYASQWEGGITREAYTCCGGDTIAMATQVWDVPSQQNRSKLGGRSQVTSVATLHGDVTLMTSLACFFFVSLFPHSFP